MVDHCGTEDPEMQALSHLGYGNMAADRAAVVRGLDQSKVLEVVQRRNIQLIGHATCRSPRGDRRLSAYRGDLRYGARL